MPQVPGQSGSLVQRSAEPATRLQPQDFSGGWRQVAAAGQRAGEAAVQFGEQQDAIDARLDEAAVKRADNEDAEWLRQRLWTGEDAYYRQQGFDAANARAPLEEAFAERRRERAEALTTERARAMYAEVSTARFGRETEGIARHAATEIVKAERQASIARIASAADDAVLHWDDPQLREEDVQTAMFELRSQADREGWDPDVLERAEFETRSAITGRVIDRLVDTGRIEQAHAELQRNRDQLTSDAMSKAEARLYAPLLERQAESIVDDLMGTLPPLEPVIEQAQAAGEVMPRMIDITAMAESGDRERDQRGRLVTSPAGAQGRMQVMPGTQRDPGFGITPMRDNSDEERSRVGREYLQKMMERYGNDPAKAWAAYNWGPGNLDKAISKYGSDWLRNAPEETRNYVRRNVAALGGRPAGTSPTQQSPREHDMAELLARVDGMNLPFDLEQQVRRNLTQRVQLDETLLRRDQSSAAEEAWSIVNSKGGGFTNINQIPASIRQRLSPQDLGNFQAQAAANSAPSTNWTAYDKYSRLYAEDPDALAAISTIELRRNLGDTEFKQVSGWVREALRGEESTGASNKQVTHSRVRSVTQPLLRAAGIFEPSTAGKAPRKKDETKEAYYARVAEFENAVLRDIAVWQQNNPGKLPTDNEIRNIADANLIRLYRRDGETREEAGFFFELRGTKERGLVMDIPAAEHRAIVAEYRRQWNREPTPGEIARIYARGPAGGR